MERKRLLNFIFAALLALALTFVAQSLFNSLSKKGKEDKGVTASREIMVAASELPVNTLLKPEMIQWREWKTGPVPLHYITKDKIDPKKFPALLTRSQLMAQEPITTENTTNLTHGNALAFILAPGMRAVSLPVDLAGANNGLVFPGNYVDVIAIRKISASKDTLKKFLSNTKVIAEKVRILAVDQKLLSSTSEDKTTKISPPQTVTLEVSPRQAETILSELNNSRLALALHSVVPAKISEEAGYFPSDLPTEAPPLSVKVVRGSTITEVKVKK